MLEKFRSVKFKITSKWFAANGILSYLKEHNANLYPGKSDAFPVLEDVEMLSLGMKNAVYSKRQSKNCIAENPRCILIKFECRWRESSDPCSNVFLKSVSIGSGC